MNDNNTGVLERLGGTPFNLSGVGTNLRRIKRALWIKWKMETRDSAIGFHTRKGQPSSDV